MKTAKFLVPFVAAVFLAAVSARAMVEPAVSDTRYASCLVRVTCAPGVLPFTGVTIRYLLRSPGVGGKAAKDVLGIASVDNLLEIEELSGEPGAIKRRVAETLPSDRDREEMQVKPQSPKEAKGESLSEYGMLREATKGRVEGVTTPPSGIGRTATAQEPDFIDESTVFFRLEVALPGAVEGKPVKPAAEEFMNVVIKNMREALNIAADDFRSRIRARIDLAGDEAARAERELMELQAKLRELSGSGPLSRGDVLGDISGLWRELRSIAMKRATQSVTIEAITKKIAEAEAKATEKLKSDSVTNELQRLLELQVLHLESVKKLVETGRTSQAELADAEERLARARIELAKRREELTKSTGGDLIASLNNQLSNLSIETPQYEARLSNIEEQLQESKALLTKADEYELVSMKADIARQNLQEAIMWRYRMSREERLFQVTPTVTVLGSGGI
jgi:hypothetical protein